MTTGANMTSVAYKKGNWMRYTLWGLAAICVVVLLTTFITTLNGGVSATVPDGYRFSVSDSYNSHGKIRTTYYVYHDKIIVEDESFEDNKVNRSTLVYDGVSADAIQYDASDVTEICELGSCHEVPKALVVIRKLISRKTAREYIGL